MMDGADILDFWFSESTRLMWFRSTPEFDAMIMHRYESLWMKAAAGEMGHWRPHAKGALALVLVLDQFPLNMYRGLSRGFATEAQAREVSQLAIQQGFDKNLHDSGKVFLYMPFMHSENVEDQALSVQLFENAERGDNLRFARHHHDIIQRFGRFPHRNSILGRKSTPAEINYLNSKEAFNPK
jgi:uncharacterized protein (DUF924 family)